MSRRVLLAKNLILATSLTGFVGGVYWYTMQRMKAVVSACVHQLCKPDCGQDDISEIEHELEEAQAVEAAKPTNYIATPETDRPKTE